VPAPGFEGAIFDVDGVLVDSPHERAWQDSLRELMETSGPTSRARPRGPTAQVYQQVMSGKPRMDGALAALEHFEVPDAAERVMAYATNKQTLVIKLIEAGEFEAYPDALGFVLAVSDAGIPWWRHRRRGTPGCSSARSGSTPLPSEQGLHYDFLRPGLSLLEFFDVDISGRDFAQGKPHGCCALDGSDSVGAGCAQRRSRPRRSGLCRRR